MPRQTGFGMVTLFDDFLLSADHSGWNDNTENSGTAAQLANREDGYIELTTGTTIGNRSQITGERVFRAESGGPLTFECAAVMITDATEKGVFYGLTDVTTIENPIEVTAASDALTTTATDGVGIIFDEDQSTTDRYFLVGVDSDVDAGGNGVMAATFAGSISSPTSGTDQSFKLMIDPAGAAHFYIDETEVHRGNVSGWTNDRALTGAVSPDVNLCPTVLVETRESGANTLYADYIFAAKGRNP